MKTAEVVFLIRKANRIAFNITYIKWHSAFTANFVKVKALTESYMSYQESFECKQCRSFLSNK